MHQSKPKSVGPHLWQITAIREAAVVVLAIGCLIFAIQLSNVFAPVLLALLAAYLFQPIVRLAKKYIGWGPSLTVAVFLVLLLALLVALAFWLGPLLRLQIGHLVQALPNYAAAIVSQVDARLRSMGIDYQTSDLESAAKLGAGRLLGIAQRLMRNAADVALAVVLWLICFYAFAAKWNKIPAHLSLWTPAALHGQVDAVLQILGQAFSGFFHGRLLIALVNAVLFPLAWKLTGVPFWLFLGLFAALLNIVPFLSGLVWVAAILVNYGDRLISAQAADLLSVFILPTVAFAAVHVIEGWILTPLIQSQQVNLSPAAIVVAIAAGGAIGGVVGMLFAIPCAAAVKMLVYSAQPSAL